MESDMSYTYLQASGAEIERRRLTALIDQLQATMADKDAQLESTEKAYDRSLQENLKLQDRVRTFTTIRLAGPLGMGPEPARRWLQARQAEKDQATKMAGSIEEEEQVATGFSKLSGHTGSAVIIDDPYATTELSPERISEIKTWYTDVLPTDPKTEAAVDEAFAAAREKTNRRTVLTKDNVSSGIEPVFISGLRRVNSDLNRRRREAQGDRAKMKDTLVRTQNACRRYKTILKRQKPQLEALQELANAAFPLYEALLAELPGMTRLHAGALERQCEDFHNKFNEAAEALTNE